jgi:tetraacyldisaccharide 4'-kinase
MRDPSFWWRPPGAMAALLAPLAAAYGAVAGARLRQPGRRAGIPVLCIGNPTVGGAGKTPTALAFARWLTAAGERPCFLSRGYGGRLAGPVQVVLATHSAADVGDEPLLLARAALTVVGGDRGAGASAASAAGASVIVMDDGFQNPALVKDVSVLVVDARRGIGNGRVLPAGPLRAPLPAQLARADALLVIGPGTAAEAVIRAAAARGLAVGHGRLAPDAGAVAALAGQRVLAFAGIGDPEKFFATVAAAGIDAPLRQAFPDHHRYTRADAQGLVAQAEQAGLALLTTEKDLVRLAGDADTAVLAGRAQALPVTLAIDDGGAFRTLVLDKLAAARAAAKSG